LVMNARPMVTGLTMLAATMGISESQVPT